MPVTLLHSTTRHGFPADVGARIREARSRRAFQQRELASRANLDQPTLSKYESGVHPPSIRRLCGIARALALPVDCLMPPLLLPLEVDRELYAFFRAIWFAPLAARGAAALALRGLLEPGGPDAYRR